MAFDEGRKDPRVVCPERPGGSGGLVALLLTEVGDEAYR